MNRFSPFHLEAFVLSASSRGVTYCTEISPGIVFTIFSAEPAFPLEADADSQNTAWELMFTKLAV